MTSTALRQLQDAAASGTSSVSTLLRRLKLLSVRGGVQEPVNWVDAELNGYPDSSELPAYRGPFDLIALGHFMGRFQSELRGVQIPPLTFPEKFRKGLLFEVSLYQSIAEIEQLASKDTVRISWGPDGVALYNHMVERGEIQRITRQDMVLVEASIPLSQSLIAGVVDTVRTRILDVAIGWEELVSSDPEIPVQLTERPALIQRFKTIVYGAGANVAVSSQEVQQSITLNFPPRGDVTALMGWLAGQGVSESDIGDLEKAMAADAEDDDGHQTTPTGPGPRVRGWLGTLAMKSATAAGSVSSGAAGGLIAQAIAHHYGIA